MLPPEILKFCLACRRETLHLHSRPGISNKPLYACTEACGSPEREVTDPELKTPAAINLRAVSDKAQQERWRKESEAEEYSLGNIVYSHTSRRPTMAKIPKAPPLRVAIENIVEECFSHQPQTLTREDVTSIIDKRINELLGTIPLAEEPAAAAPARAAGTCPRQPHKGKCPSAWCRKAGYEE